MHDERFNKAVKLALDIYQLDNNHGTLDFKAGPQWAKNMYKLIDELKLIINSLNTSEFIKYCDLVTNKYPPNISEIIIYEWKDVRSVNKISQILSQIFRKKQK